MYIIGISVAAKKEWEAVLNKLNVSIDKCNTFPFGEYFKTNLYGEDIIFYRCGGRKMNSSASAQYMIDHFNLNKIIVAGTCAGIDDSYKKIDIFFPNKLVQYDCTVKETEPFIKDSFTAAIAFVCKANNVECVVIKGISDFPTNENETTYEESYEGQLNEFLTNIPIIMNNIIDNYLEYAIKTKFNYID